jgi:hypothetical protein
VSGESNVKFSREKLGGGFRMTTLEKGKHRKVTLKTIADHLGLTPGTVSAALNNSGGRSIPEHQRAHLQGA